MYILRDHIMYARRRRRRRRCREAETLTHTQHRVHKIHGENRRGERERERCRGERIGGKYIGWDVYIPPTMSITPRVTRRLYERMQLAPDVKRRTPVSKFDGATRAPSITSEISRSFFPSYPAARLPASLPSRLALDASPTRHFAARTLSLRSVLNARARARFNRTLF